MNNYMLYVGSGGVYTHTVAYERDPNCVVCSPGVAFEIGASATLQELIDALVTAHPDSLAAPSVSYGSVNLYMRGALEEDTKHNLTQVMSALMGGDTEGTLVVNDKKLHGPMRVRLTLT